MSQTFLIGHNISQKQLSTLSKLLDLTPWDNGGKNFSPTSKTSLKNLPENFIVLSDDLNDSRIKDLLALPSLGIIDANALPESIQNFFNLTKKSKTENKFNILMTCPVLYACDIALLFTNALQERLFFSKALFENIHLALHESLVNGLIHGNLQLSSNLRQSARDFIEYARILSERLNDPTYAQKSISIMAFWDEDRLEIKIRDEGIGYTEINSIKKPEMTSAQAKSGRGLRLIAGLADSCTLDDFGREVTLSFSRHEHIKHIINPEVAEEEKYDSINNIDDPDLSKCRVLIMEDNPSNQTVLTRLLNVVGITNIQIAADGIEGLHKVLSFKPDLIILDITMPRMNGQEVLYHLKAAPETRHIPVLVQTASDTREMREKAFSSGATDFITKPINPLEFFARVKVHLENRILIYNLRHQLDQIENEMQSARRMQVNMLPHKDHIEEFCHQFNIKLAHYFEPSSTLGGDFWQLFPIRGENLGFYLCDFSGHGTAAALNTFRLHGIIAQMDKKKIISPAEFLQNLNQQLFDLLPRGQFATFFFSIFNPKTKVMEYAGAGSPQPFIIHKNKTLQLDTDGLPLGIMKDTKYVDKKIQLSDEDSLFFYSDALTESPSPDGKRLGTDGLKTIVEKYIKDPNIHNSLRLIMNDFFDFSQPPPPDDVTAILVRIGKK